MPAIVVAVVVAFVVAVSLKSGTFAERQKHGAGGPGQRHNNRIGRQCLNRGFQPGGQSGPNPEHKFCCIEGFGLRGAHGVIMR